MDFSSENLINEHSEKNYSHSAELVKILRDFCSDEKEIKEYLQVLEKDYLKQYMRDYSKVINKKFQEMSHTKEFDEKFNNLNSEQVKIICEDMNEYLYEFRETIRKEDKGIYDQQIYYNEATYSPYPNLSRNDLTMSEDHAKLVSRYLDKLALLNKKWL